MRCIQIFSIFYAWYAVAWSQVIIPDFQVNDSNLNSKGLGRTSIAAMADGTFGVAWHDYNDYNNPVTEQPRIAVQMLSPNANAIGPLNLFRGESRSLSIWTSDFLSANSDLAFLPDGTLLVAVEHRGDLSVAGDFIRSSETGIGAVSSTGQIIDASPNFNGVIFWLIPTALDDEENPRLATSATGGFVVLNGPTFQSNRSAVGIQQFDADGNFIGEFFTPHTSDPDPQFNHGIPDMATNGSIHLVVWQDGRQDANFDISAQFYNNSGAIGGNLKVNQSDANGVINIYPSVDMNSSGLSVVVWADSRTSAAGDIFGQRYDASGQPIGDNFQVSAGEGEIWDRPEVAVREDGSFMVVWTDSMSGAVGIDALRARGRQYDANGNPTGPPFIVPEQDVASGLVNIATDGSFYYCAWLDDREGDQNPDIFAKKIGSAPTSVTSHAPSLPTSVELYPAYPNPFNPGTTIRFALPNAAEIRLDIYNLLGQHVTTLVHEFRQAGEYTVDVDASHWNSGIYFYKLTTGDRTSITRKMVLAK